MFSHICWFASLTVKQKKCALTKMVKICNKITSTQQKVIGNWHATKKLTFLCYIPYI